jgi:hypothetical protein
MKLTSIPALRNGHMLSSLKLKREQLNPYEAILHRNVFFSKMKELRKVKMGPTWGLIAMGEHRINKEVKESEYSGSNMYLCMKMEKMRPVETVLTRWDGI